MMPAASPSLVLLAVATLGAPLAAQKGDASWPQWRGPDRDGISKETGWSVEGKPEPVWKKNVGLGYSTVSIDGGHLYTLGHDAEALEDVVYCLDPLTGQQIWTYRFGAETMANMHSGGSLATPSVGNGKVFVADREGRLICLDAKTGKEVWLKDMKTAEELTVPTWGFSGSPLVLGDTVYMNMGVVAAYTMNGEQLWKTRNYGDCYSTPMDLEVGGRPCLAVFNARGLFLIDRKSGKEMAGHPWRTMSNVNAATPVVIGKDRIFISSGYNKGCAMLKVVSPEKLEVVWESKVMRNQMSGCVHYESHLYGVDGSTFKCIDLDGKEKWSARTGNGAFLLAGDKLLILTDRGDLVVAAAKPDKFQELSRQKVLDGGKNWTTPVLFQGLVYCRNSNGDLVCIDHRGTAKTGKSK